MNIQNMVRFALLLILIYCTGSRSSFAQDGVVADASATLTLEQLKAEGAAKSRYRQHNEASSAVKETQTKDTVAAFEQLIKPVLKEACVQCHGPDHVEGNIRIDTLNPDLVNGSDSHWWLEVQAVLSNGEMPPPDAESLKDTDRAKVVEWLADEIQRASKIRRETGGHSSFRRLTRYEYNYALQDLLGVKWNFAKDLPPESHSDDGFQNSSELLHMSVGQLESYRQIALTALRRVTVRGERPLAIHWGISMEEAADREWPKLEFCEQIGIAEVGQQIDPPAQFRIPSRIKLRTIAVIADNSKSAIHFVKIMERQGNFGHPRSKQAFVRSLHVNRRSSRPVIDAIGHEILKRVPARESRIRRVFKRPIRL
jgi:mono/diheme cytochrome c family protein